MARLKVDVEQVIGTANRIKNLNNQMRDGFSSVQDAITRLDGTWDGSAATNAISKFNTIKNSYCDARYKVIDNFVAFLHQQVGEAYGCVESVNKSLADQFK